MARAFVAASSTDVVSVADNAAIDNLNAITMAAWIRPTATGITSNGNILGKMGAATWANPYAIWNLRTNVSNQLESWVNSGAIGGNYCITTSPTLSADVWQHVAATYDATTLKNYINGSLGTPSTTISAALATNTFQMLIGNVVTAASPFDGNIAEVAVWSRVLAASEIAGLGKGYTPNHFMEGLVGYWPLIGRTSPEIELINGNGGTLTGTAASAHPRIIMPRKSKSRRFSFAPPPTLQFAGFMGTSGV